MKSAILMLLALTALAAEANAARPSIKVREQAIETSTLALQVPRTRPRSIAVKKCSTCGLIVLQLTPQSKFRVGREDATFAQFAAHLNGATQRPINVFYDAGSKTVTRMTTTGVLAAQQPPGRRDRRAR
jgi:hypothetical protein